MGSYIVTEFIKYLNMNHTINEKDDEYERVLKILKETKDNDAKHHRCASHINESIKKVVDAYEEYLIDGSAWCDMEREMLYEDEDF